MSLSTLAICVLVSLGAIPPSPYELKRADKHRGAVSSVVVAGNDEVISAGWDESIRRWDIDTLEERGDKPVEGDKITELAISPKGDLLASASLGTAFHLWVRDFPKGGVFNHLGEEDILDAVAFSPDGKLLAVGNSEGGVVLWDVSKAYDGKKFTTSPSDKKREIVITVPVEELAFTADSQQLLIAGSEYNGPTLQIWNVATGKMVSEAQAYDGLALAVSADGKSVCVGNNLRDGKTGKRLGAYWNATAAVYAPNSKWVATGGPDNRITIWEPQSRKLLAAVRAHDDEITSLAVTPDGKKLVSASKDGLVKIWDVPKMLADHPNEEPMAKAAALENGYECWRLGLCWTRAVLNAKEGDSKLASEDEAEKLAKSLGIDLPAIPKDGDFPARAQFIQTHHVAISEAISKKFGDIHSKLFLAPSMLLFFQQVLDPEDEERSEQFKTGLMPDMVKDFVAIFGAVPTMFATLEQNVESGVPAEVAYDTFGLLIRELDMGMEGFKKSKPSTIEEK